MSMSPTSSAPAPPTDSDLLSPPLPAPPPCEVPHFPPVRAGGGRPQLGRTGRRRLLAAGLATAAAVLAGGASYGAVRGAPAVDCPSPAAVGRR
ncbi:MULTISPECIES: hypothetical protein [unclassified Streptomyces]|uniref:hypothetical protein n=1 Tax=unclassified Streptomyces TaxID=2593676 RepID=UPI00115FE91B|nr:MULTISPECIES: hypothetical protein [unclassified Streptomyces]